jgi:hypothetical protein
MAISGCDQQLIDQWKNEAAPLPFLLHTFHNRDGYFYDDAMKAISACGHGMAAPHLTESPMNYFPEQVEAATYSNR